MRWINRGLLLALSMVLVGIGICSFLVSAIAPSSVNSFNLSVINESLSFRNESFYLDKDFYSLGEEVLIYANIANLTDIERVVITRYKENYRFVGNFNNPLVFVAPDFGDYTVSIFLKNGSLYKKKFSVINGSNVSENMSESSLGLFLKTNKINYFVGDEVVINFNLVVARNYSLLIYSNNSIFQYLGILKSPLVFLPREAGKYVVEINDLNSTLVSTVFYVRDKEITGDVYTDKSVYNVSERVTIGIIGNATELKVVFGNDSFNFIKPKREVVFIPKRQGKYKIVAIFREGNRTKRVFSYFDVLIRKEKETNAGYFFSISEDVVVRVDFSDIIESKKTIIEKIFGISPIEKIVAYVMNHGNDNRFNLTIEDVSNGVVVTRIKKNPKIEPSLYFLVVEVTLHNEVIRRNVSFMWGNISEWNITSNFTKTANKSNITDISRFVKYYFSINDTPEIAVDFTDEINKPRNILEIALGKPKVEKISAYVEGEEQNNDFSLYISHIELDKFLVVINNKVPKKDIYSLVVVAKVDDRFFLKQILFDWGLDNISLIRERVKVKNKTVTLEEALRVTGIGYSVEKEKLNKSLNKTINKTNELINLSNKLINYTRINITEKENLVLYTNKDVYKIGERVYIYSNARLSNLEILLNDTPLFSKDNVTGFVSFVPKKTGDYKIEALALVGGSIEILAANFSVALSEKANISLTPSKINRIENLEFLVRDFRNKNLSSVVRLYRGGALISELTNVKRRVKLFGAAIGKKGEIGIEKGEYDVEVIPKEVPIKRIFFRKLKIRNNTLSLRLDNFSVSKVDIKRVKKERIVNTFAIDPSDLNFSDAIITVRAKGNSLWKCRLWNFSEQRCYGAWTKIKELIPGREYNLTLMLEDPAYAEVNITIINVQSYPTVGGNWTVRFNTTGVANLMIRAVNGTTWSNSSEDNDFDLRFLEIRCGNRTLPYKWVNDSLFIQDYGCNETGYEVSEVLTTGKHTLEFRFGDDIEYARNLAGWWNDSWKRRKKLTFNNTGINENLTNFVVMVRLTPTRINYSEIKSDGSDIRFIDSDDSTQLFYEIEEWNYNGDSIIWVKVPRIDANNDSDFIYIYYNNSNAPPGENATGVWSDYYAVWHMTEVNARDSSPNGYNGSANAGVSFTSSGKIDGADNFNGNGYIGVSGFPNIQSNFTIEAWIYTNNNAESGQRIFCDDESNSGGYALSLGDPGTGALRFYSRNMDSIILDTSTGVISNSQWYYVVGVADRTNEDRIIYVDGVVKASDLTDTGTWGIDTGMASIGGETDSGETGNRFNGILDEVRVSKKVRSQDWINASYLSMKDSFVIFEGEESATPPVITSVSVIPASPFDNQNLNCSFIVNDQDANETLYANITWYRDSVRVTDYDVYNLNVSAQGTFYTNISVPNNATSPGENWTCSVVVWDKYELKTSVNGSATISDSQPWWNGSWLYRKRIVVTNNYGSVLPANFTVKISSDDLGIKSLINEGKVRQDGGDIRVVYNNSKEVIHVYDDFEGSIYFKTGSSMEANSTAIYYVYYGNSNATYNQSTYEHLLFTYYTKQVDSSNNGDNIVIAAYGNSSHETIFEVKGTVSQDGNYSLYGNQYYEWTDQYSSGASVVRIRSNKPLFVQSGMPISDDNREGISFATSLDEIGDLGKEYVFTTYGSNDDTYPGDPHTDRIILIVNPSETEVVKYSVEKQNGTSIATDQILYPGSFVFYDSGDGVTAGVYKVHANNTIFIDARMADSVQSRDIHSYVPPVNGTRLGTLFYLTEPAGMYLINPNDGDALVNGTDLTDGTNNFSEVVGAHSYVLRVGPTDDSNHVFSVESNVSIIIGYGSSASSIGDAGDFVPDQHTGRLTGQNFTFLSDPGGGGVRQTAIALFDSTTVTWYDGTTTTLTNAGDSAQDTFDIAIALREVSANKPIQLVTEWRYNRGDGVMYSLPMELEWGEAPSSFISYSEQSRIAPTISLEFPSDNSKETQNKTPTFYFNVTGSVDSYNCTLYLDNGTGAVVYANNESTSDGVSTSFTLTVELPNLQYYWFVNCSDGIKTSMSSVYNLSMWVDYSPSVVLSLPENNSFETSSMVIFNCSADDDFDIVNVSLYTNLSGGFSVNQTKTFTGSSDTSVVAIFNITFNNENDFIWSCLAYDNGLYDIAPQSSFATENRTVRVRFPVASFTDITSSTNLSNRTTGIGVCVEDYNQNGFLDVALLGDDEGSVNLFNNTLGTNFRNDSNALSSGSNLGGRGCSFGDYNNDGYGDFITASDFILYKSNGDGTFSCADSKGDNACSGNILPTTTFATKGIQFFDYNNDSFLDIWAPDSINGPVIFTNNGNGTFSSLSLGSQTPDGYSVVVDYDGDNDLDLFAVDGTSHIIFRNENNGSFTYINPSDIGLPTQVRSSAKVDNFTWGFGDYDNDGDLDVFITATGILERNFFENNGNGTFTDRTVEAGLPTNDLGTNPVWGDYDNDGYLDLLIGGVGLYRNNGDKTFTDKTSDVGLVTVPDSAEFFDYDNDGDLDIIGQTKEGRTILYRNDLDNLDYLKIIVKGLGNKSYYNFSNRDAIGAKIDVYDSSNSLVCHREVSGGESYSQAPKMQHCGLDYTSEYLVNVTFPSGVTFIRNVTPKYEQITIGGNILSHTIEVNEVDAGPTTSLVSPPLNAVDVDGDVTFTCSAIDNIDLVNISLFTNISGTFSINQTVNFTGGSDRSNTTTFTITGIPTGTVFVWNCLAYDAGGSSDFADVNHTVTITTGTINVNVTPDSTTYGTGDAAVITVNTTDNTYSPLEANITTDIIFGNATYLWWNTSWLYRKPIIVTENSGSNLIEYQINLTIDTSSLISEDKLNANCSDLRFTNSSNDLIDFWIESGCNTTSTVVWVKIPSLPADSNTTIYMYYGNKNATSLSNATRTFSYSSLKGVMYVVSSVIDSSGNVDIVSFRDNNTVSNGTSSIDVNESDIASFSNTQVSQNSAIYGLKPFFASGDVSGTDALVPISFASRQFIYSVGRRTDRWHVYSPFGDANVSIYDGNDGAGWTLVDSPFTVNQGSAITVIRNIANTDSSTDTPSAVLINSTHPILVTHDTSRGTDAFVLYPPSTDWWGVPGTRFDIGVLEDETTITILESDGTNTTILYNSSQDYHISGLSEDGAGTAYHVISDKPIGVTQVSDGDGSETTTFLPESELDNEYYIPQQASYITVASTKPYTNCTIYRADGSVLTTSLTTQNQNYPFPSKWYYGSDEGGDIPAGSRLICNATVFAYYEFVTAAGGQNDDEHNLLGRKAMRQYVYPGPTSAIEFEQMFVQRDINQTNTNGLYNFTFNTTGHYIGDYSAVSYATKKNYLDGYDYAFFTIVSGGEYPIITIVHPLNGSTINEDSVYLNITTSKDATCKYDTNKLFDYDTQGTLFDVTGGTTHKANLGSLSEGSYTYYIKCRDSIGNTNDNSNQGSTTFTVDRTNPTIQLNNPLDNSNQTSSAITFIWTADDNIDDTLLCDLTLNGQVVASSVSSAKGSQTTYTVKDITNGNYTWNVSCFDNANNYNTSVTYSFSLEIIDLVIDVKSENKSYKQNRDVKLTPSTVWSSGDKESGVKQAKVDSRFAGEFGFYEDISTQWTWVPFTQEFAETPVVIHTTEIDGFDYNGESGGSGDYVCLTRIKGVNRSGFFVRLDDWDNRASYDDPCPSGGVTGINVQFVAMVPGNYYLSDNTTRVEVHNVSRDGTTGCAYAGSWRRDGANLNYASSFAFTPYVFASVQTANDDDEINTVVRGCNVDQANPDTEYDGSCVMVALNGMEPSSGDVCSVHTANETIGVLVWGIDSSQSDNPDNGMVGDGDNVWKWSAVRSSDEVRGAENDPAPMNKYPTSYDSSFGTDVVAVASGVKVDGSDGFVPVIDIDTANDLVYLIAMEDENSDDDQSHPKEVMKILVFNDSSGYIYSNETMGGIDLNTSFYDYNFSGLNFTELSYIELNIELSYYNASVSSRLGTAYPDLEVRVYDGSDYSYSYFCNAYGTYGVDGNYSWNCSKEITNNTILRAWNDSNNRKIRIRGVYLDGSGDEYDIINWSGVYADLYLPSRFDNIGPTELTGNLLLQVLVNDSGSFVEFSTIYNKTVSIAPNESIDIAHLWNYGGSWKYSNWEYRKNITINSSMVNEDLIDFPLFLELNSSNFDFSKAKSNGEDLRFVGSSGNELAYEIEKWNSTTQKAEIWVKVPFISSSSDTEIVMYYGNPNAPPGENATGVWSDYYAVWHMTEVDAIDSSPNGYNGSANAGVSFTSSGKIDGADNFNGNGYIGVSGFPNIQSNFTIEAWVYTNNNAEPGQRIFCDDETYSGGSSGGYALSLGDPGAGALRFYSRSMDSIILDTSTGVISNSQWYYVVGVADRTNEDRIIYVDGVVEASDLTDTGTWGIDPGMASIGGETDSGETGSRFNGILDEVRVSNKVRSQDWINASYQNQRFPSTFYSFEPEEKPSRFNTDNNPLGTYLVYAALVDSNGNVIQNGDGSYIEDNYSFVIDYLRINITSPLNNSVHDVQGFYVNVSLQYKSYPSGGTCYYSIDSGTNVTMDNISSVEFSKHTGTLSFGQHYIQFFCNDTGGEFSYSYVYNFTAEDLIAPNVTILTPANNSEEPNGNVSFVYKVEDISSNISNCTLIFDFFDNETSSAIQEGINQTFNLTDISFGQHRWQVKCVDNSSNHNIGYSEESVFLVGYDTSPPVITLLEPENNTYTQNNDVVFKYKAYDQPVADNIDNCSLIINGKINQTNSSIKTQAGEINSFVLNNLPVAQYNWSINCTDGAVAHNVGASDTFNLTIGEDTDFPVITLISPDNNYTDTDGNIVFYYNVSDASGGIANCTIYINGTMDVQDTSTTVEEDTPQSFTVNGLVDGNYSWQINCTDDSFQANSNGSEIRHFNVSIVYGVNVEVSSRNVYEKGTEVNETIVINTTTKDELYQPINTSVTTYIVNTDSWFDPRWRYRRQINITETTGSDLVDYQVNLSIDTQTLISEGKMNADCSDLRVTKGNKSELSYWIENISLCNTSSTIVWIKTNLTASSVNVHYLYYGNPFAVNKSNITTTMGWLEFANTSVVDENYKTINLAHSFSSPIVTSSLEYGIGPNAPPYPAGVIIKDVTSNSFKVKADRPSGSLTGNTITKVHYAVMEEGSWLLLGSSALIQGGKINTTKDGSSSSGWGSPTYAEVVNFPVSFNSDPVILATRVTENNNLWAVTYVASVGDKEYPPNTTSMDLGLLSGQLGDQNFVVDETIHWIGIDDSISGIANGVRYSAERSADVVKGFADNPYYWSTSFTQQGYTKTPEVIVTQKLLEDAGDGAWSVLAEGYSTSSSWASFVDETKESDRKHRTEIVGAISFEVAGSIPIRKYVSSLPTISSIGEEEDPLLENQSDTGSDGLITFSFDSSNLSTGNYWAVSVASSSDYNDGYNLTSFVIRVDMTPPDITLILPNDGEQVSTNNVTFYYNVTDSLSGVTSCSFVWDGTIAQTNNSVTEGQTLQFKMYNLPNGNHQWNVNCTDDSPNSNIGSSEIRDIVIAVDTSPPTITLENPSDGYNDTDGFVIFEYSVVDDYNGIENCSLLINGEINQTDYTVVQGVTQRFNLSNLTDAYYTWAVECYDNSSNYNSNVSETRGFNVILDYGGPIVTLIFPDNGSHLVDPNVTFVYNVTDAVSGIANCSLILNNNVNQTNSTVQENQNQSFYLTDLPDGNYNWSVRCTDDSDRKNVNYSVTYGFLISPDNEPPVISLISPPDGIEDPDGNVSFTYNVTDFASDIKNCSLIINGTINQTNTEIEEGFIQQFDLYDLGVGDYSWSINCTDTALIPNTGNSSTRIFSVGTDTTPPDITLLSPSSGTVDSDGNLLFEYMVDDYGSEVSNCSLIINNKINVTNTSIQEGAVQNFTITGLVDGDYNWSINCTDNSSYHNTGNSSTWNFTVTIDLSPPSIILVSPSDNALDTNGSVTFYYSVTDALNGISNCTLYLDDSPVKSNNSVEEGVTQSFFVGGLGDGIYVWNINCTDDSDNHNIGGSEKRNLNVTIDTVAPIINLIDPQNGTLETDGYRVFYYNVTDVISNVTSCSLILNGIVQETNYSIEEGVIQSFALSGLTTGNYNWSVNCTDGSEYSNTGASEKRYLNVLIDTTAPVVSLISPENYTQDLDNNVTFYYNVTDENPIANCSLIINGTINQTNSSVSRDTTLSFVISGFDNITIEWSVNCTDLSESNFVGASEKRILVVGPDVVGPEITLINPPNDIQDPDGNVIFEYVVNDFASGVENCSLIFNGSVNQTNSSIQEGITQRFYLNGIPNGNYTWQVNCTDNSSNHNIGSSIIRNLTIGMDMVPPDITLVNPENNSIVNSDSVVFEYVVDDFASNVSNCSLIINNKINATNKSIEENVPQYFYVSGFLDGSYNWSVNCTDDSSNHNTGSSSVFNMTIFLPRPIVVNITTDQTSYEQGTFALITVNTTNSSGSMLDTSVKIDIIKGNATVPWWNTSFAYRVRVDVNTTNVSRYNKLIEHTINFTDILVNDINLTNVTLDNNSIRIVEWTNNVSVEIPSQFKPSSNFDGNDNAMGTVMWILNSTTEKNTVRVYYIYFDILENGNKPLPSYDKPTFSFVGSSKSIMYDSSSITADFVNISKDNESLVLQFIDGDGILNQLNLDYPGAGSISAIHINNNRLTNDNSSIVPIAVSDDDYLTTDSISVVESGFVASSIIINGSINSVSNSNAQINYTIWFVDDEIYVRARLYADFASEETNPVYLFNNIWFAYLFDEGSSSWNNFINILKSETYNDTHDYYTVSADMSELDSFHQTDWYSELDYSLGSVNLYLENFTLNGLGDTKGIISFDDQRLPTGEQSDGVGFNLNSDEDIVAGDKYSLTVWMIFSSNTSYTRALDLKEDIENPIKITQHNGQKLANRTEGATSNGIYSFNYSTSMHTPGAYSIVALASKTYYNDGFNHKLFYVTKDLTAPNVSLISPEGWINTNDVDFTFSVYDSNSIHYCSVIIDNKVNETSYSITNNAENTITVYGIDDGTYNWTVNCTDWAGNTGTVSEKIIHIDTVNPSVNLSSPYNTQILNSSDVEFNFTVTDNIDKNLTCRLYIDSTLRKEVNATNGSMTSTTVSGLTQSIHDWYVKCSDEAGNEDTSATWYFTVDLGPPSVTLNSPVNDSWDNTGNITFVYTPSDVSSIENCSLIINGKVNKTDDTISNNQQNSFALYNLTEGKYYWAVNCTDATGLIGGSVTYILNVDKTRPSVNLTSPDDGAPINTSNVTFNFTALDNMDYNLSCNLTLDGILNRSNIEARNGSVTSVNVEGVNDGTHYWNVTCWDSATNSNTSLTRSFSVDTAPTVDLVSPDDNRWFNTTNITFHYIPFDNVGLVNCSLIINGVVNITNTTINNNSQNNFTVYNIGEGAYNWTVNCTDPTGNTGTAGERTFYVDLTEPSIKLLKPEDGHLSPLSSVQFNFTASDNMDDVLECNIIINGTVNNTNVIEVWNNTNTSYNVSGLTDGLFYWNITCWDNANNTNTSITRNFSIAEPPSILLGGPENGYWTNKDNVTFFFTPNDNSGNIVNCSLILNGVVNKTNNNIVVGQENNISVDNLADSTYNWTINCSDETGNIGTNDTGKILYVDTTEPSITLNHPNGSAALNYDDVNFNWTAVDNLAKNMTCNLTLDGVVNISNITAVNGSFTNVTVFDLNFGTHYWNVTCWDYVNNTNTSITITFQVNAPDLAINSSGIMFNNTSPAEGDNVTINATVYNLGGIPAYNFVVQFFEKNLITGKTTLIDNVTVSSLDYGASRIVNTTWIASLGNHEISVLLDPYYSVSELNESNNNASVNISISIWHIVYGESLGDLLIRDLSNKTVFRWYVTNVSSGSVYVADYDSVIDWSNLTAISRNVSGGLDMDDFEEIDTALNTSKYVDSVNRTFTHNGNLKGNTSFFVFRKEIDNVPIVNSTNNSNFITGILWDMSDDTNGEYNGSEDIVFVTKINPDKQGAYGIYDYEIRVPAELKKYREADVYSVVFYVELK